MLLDQQVPMEWAFRGPATLRERLGGLDAATIAALDPDELDRVFREKPALHRYPGSMAKRTHALCDHVVKEYGGDASKIWKDSSDRSGVRQHRALPATAREGRDRPLAILREAAPRRADVTGRSSPRPFSDA
jgi:uncharacterized HhH-GPD family protein